MLIAFDRADLDRARAALDSWRFDNPGAQINRVTVVHQPGGGVRIEAQYREAGERGEG
jgi:hypothetical protein